MEQVMINAEPLILPQVRLSIDHVMIKGESLEPPGCIRAEEARHPKKQAACEKALGAEVERKTERNA